MEYELPAGYRQLYSGKVRDLFETPSGDLLFVASDRISAHDFVLPTLIPDKGRILTALSLWWFEQIADLVPNHVLSTNVPPSVAGRSMICRRLDMVPIECVARGYLAGSGLAEYRETSSVCGVQLPPGLVESSRLPEPIFTPATKAEIGEHDENIDFAHAAAIVGGDAAAELRDLTLRIFQRATSITAERGLILADTKFEFGRDSSGQLVLADEVLTPDSSRYWPVDHWQPGRAAPSFDKQFVRDWLVSPASGWDRRSGNPPPPLPPEVAEQTRARYVEAYERLTGRSWV
ncbi:MAG: phosphoribosylaminoimidazolesuccinocarboxamide synthase [Candidatus Nanopelagicales bacterium]|nr:phosphoribosylaminoimidazolesuccinocarboxamide synthase [Candidatus Nanopelagicales bacterium]